MESTTYLRFGRKTFTFIISKSINAAVTLHGQTYCATENALTKKPGTVKSRGQQVLQKVGELLANMHTILIQKALKRFDRDPQLQPEQLMLKGLLLCKPWGTIFCTFTMPFVEAVSDASESSYKLSMSIIYGEPTSDSLYMTINKLLKNQ